MKPKKTPRSRIYSCILRGSDLMPLFSNIMYTMEYIEKPSPVTMSTDGIRVFYCPEWIDSITDSEVTGVLIHEMVHVVNDHPYRVRGMDLETAQIAADLAVNSILSQIPGVVLPDCGHFPGRWPHEDITELGESVEFYYRKLRSRPDSPKQDDSPDKSDDGSGKDKDDTGDSSPDDSSEQEDSGNNDTPSKEGESQKGKDDSTNKEGSSQTGETEEDDSSCSNHNGDAGDPSDGAGVQPGTPESEPEAGEGTPGGVLPSDESRESTICAAMQSGGGECGEEAGRMFEEGGRVNSPKLDTKSLLKEFLTEYTHSGFSYKRLNKKYLGMYQDIVFPGRRSINNGNILYAVDCSGSMSSVKCNTGMTVIKDLLDAYPSLKLTLVQFSKEISYEKEFSTGSDIPDKWFIKGRGGTSLDWLTEYITGRAFRCVVIYTDGKVKTPKDPGIPVCWLLTDPVKSGHTNWVISGPPYGKRVVIA